MNKRNARHNSDGGIDLEIEHPRFGWIPFTADAGDPERSGQEIYGEILLDEKLEVALHEPPPPPSLEELAALARARRDELLASTDWTQLPDVPAATRQAWAGYRQALRDLTAQRGFPDQIVWPEPPSATASRARPDGQGDRPNDTRA
jgi:hypothetical protein